ncbi:MAG: thiamine phosphate synthase [Betaproteobacteria bacterium]
MTPDIADAQRLVRDVEAAIDGGAAVVQYRNKTADRALRVTQSRGLAALCACRGALLIVNDDAGLAFLAEADGVHLGEDDGDVDAARAIVGDDKLIGVSCYDDFERARAAVASGADYVAFGSFHSSSTKPDARRARVELLMRGRVLGVPLVAIGGITSENARALIVAGAHAVAVITGVFDHRDPADISRAARTLVHAISA